MARKKVSLAWIADNASRRVTLKKRQKGLMKKVRELSVLCDVPACVVVYEPGNPRAESWPAEAEARRILARFRSMPESERAKKRVDQEGFIRQRIAKTEEQVRRQEREIGELEIRMLMQQGLAGMKSLAGVGPAEAKALERAIDETARGVRARMEEIEAHKKRMMMLPDVEVSIGPPDAKPDIMPNPINPNIIANPCPSFWEHEQKLGLGFYGGGGGYLQDVTMQQTPFMGMMMDHASSSSFYPYGDL